MKHLLRRAVCVTILLAIPALCACSGTQPYTTSFTAMDTVMTLSVYGDDEVGARMEDRVRELDRLLSATDENSEIYALNRDGHADVSADTSAVLARSLELCDTLGGSFDITVYPAVLEWGFTTGDYHVPTAERLAELSERIDYRRVSLDGSSVTLPDGFMVDTGAVAKGYAADVCGALLQGSTATAAVLNLGGTVRLYGKKPDGSDFMVGVADPMNPAAYFGWLRCGEGTVATSGGYERYFTADDGTRYIHILDPAAARPVDNGVQSVTVLTDDGAAADALSTALFVMGTEKAADYYRAHGGFDFILLTDDNTLYLSEGIADSFTLQPSYDYPITTVTR